MKKIAYVAPIVADIAPIVAGSSFSVDTASVSNIDDDTNTAATLESAPQASQAQFDDITGAIDGISLNGQPNTIYGGYVYQDITQRKNFEDYEFNVTFNYRYSISMDIYVDNGFCVTGKYWRGEWLFSNPNATCEMNLSDPPQYTYDDFIAIYGYLSVDVERNFNAYIVRDGSFSAVWFVE